MSMKTIEELRAQIEGIVHDALMEPTDREGAARHSRVPSGAGPVSVIVSPLNTLSVTAISPIFLHRSFDERSDWLWGILETVLTPAEQERVDFWLLLSPGEAKAVRPTQVSLRRHAARIRSAPSPA